jgi:hypothetical protein
MPTGEIVSVSNTVWPWRMRESGTMPAKKEHRQLRAALQAAVAGGAAFVLFRVFHRPLAALVIAVLAGVILVSGLCIPPLFRLFDRFGQWLGKTVGAALTWGLLVPFFYLVFFPARLLLLARGKDPMARRFPSPEPTYWIPRPAVPNLDQYRKQH